MDETPNASVVENIQLVVAVSFISLAPCGIHLSSASVVASTGMDAARGSLVENNTTVGELHKLFHKSLKAALTPSCVGLGWSCSHGDVMFDRIPRGQHLHSCEMGLRRVLFCQQHLSVRRWRACVPFFRTEPQFAKECSAPRHFPLRFLWTQSSLRTTVLLENCSIVVCVTVAGFCAWCARELRFVLWQRRIRKTEFDLRSHWTAFEEIHTSETLIALSV